MTSFVNSALLVEELFYKFMLKYNTQNYFSLIHENLKFLFSVKYNTHRNGNV